MSKLFETVSLTDELKKIGDVGSKIVLPVREGASSEEAGRAVSSIAYKLGVKFKTELFKAIGRESGEDIVKKFMVITLVEKKGGDYE